MSQTSHLQHLRAHVSSPAVQNAVAGISIAFSAGVFVSLNLLGAGGGRPESSHVIQTANAILSSVWFLSACVGGTYLNILGPGVTMCFGICTYALYVGSLWHYEVTGHQVFPLVGGAVIGVGAGAVFVTSGYIQVAYSNDKNKGKFIAIQNTLQAAGSIVCSILPVVLNRDNDTRAGVSTAVYVTYIALMLIVALLSLVTLRRPTEVRDATGKDVAVQERRDFAAEIRANLSVFKDWKLLLMLPAFLPAGSFLVYLGSVNAFENNLRARSLLSFIALVVQIPFGHALHLILDNAGWSKRRRALSGLAFVAIPLSAAWLWEIVRTGSLDRGNAHGQPVDWTEREFGPAMVLFVMNWTASIMWQYLVPWFIGNLDIPRGTIGHYMGVQRGFLAAGEAICFGVDAAKISYAAFSGAIFAFYFVGGAVLAYIGACHLATPSLTPVAGTLSATQNGIDDANDEKDESLTIVGSSGTRTG
ncbi:hypothetical protein BKA67DRAFT_533691 [Truncatella angustata]|uniref:Uncharacterized protein n=1 Tax=Truncatella angustata TaxID=152316 RepID=A0A9P8USY8_9PEZI|nr:uncharacterized protein BKA67DRAFT_533691 [Truncatella angustata]KAH6658540.1 hypothetical protein BKA67DRAFT_533691 [Truncatella angustata]KAH8199611.1 hypothetical protein TruAng_006204 [Truncatella angustata]